MAKEIDNASDLLDVRDVIERFEELTDLKASTESSSGGGIGIRSP